jgi:hypothetical protein
MPQLDSTAQLEAIFVQKLDEKYGLNERGVKKAFCKFDKDNNGLLDLEELKLAVRTIMNGITESQIQKLVNRYDIDGDGKISYEEFIHLCRTKKEETAVPVKAATLRKKKTGIDEEEHAYYRRDDSGRQRVKPIQEDRPPRAREGRHRQERDYDNNTDHDAPIDEYFLDDREVERHDRYDRHRHRGADDRDEFPRGKRAGDNYNQHEEEREEPFYYDDRDGRDRNRTSNNNRRHTVSDGDRGAWAGPGGGGYARQDSSQSEIESSFNAQNPRELESRCRSFLLGLKEHLLKKAINMRIEGSTYHVYT